MGEAETTAAQTVSAPEQTTAGVAPSHNETKPVDAAVKAEQPTALEEDQKDTADLAAPVEGQGSGAALSQDTKNAGESEQMFYDSLLNTSESNELGINLNFGDDNNAGDENFFNTDFGDPNAGPGLAEGNVQMPNADSGHENNAIQAGGDAFDLELQKFTNQDSNEQFGNNAEDIMGPGESSFDDLFMESENMGGNEQGDQDLLGGDGLMQLNELDDSWLT